MTEQAQLQAPGIVDRMYFLLVGGYLTLTMFFLLIAGKLDPGVSMRRVITGAFAPKISGTMDDIIEESGHCYLCEVDPAPLSDAEGHSRLTVYEDDVALAQGHAMHDAIREEGEGQYSHWGSRIFFSTSDNTDPRENGRQYRYSE